MNTLIRQISSIDRQKAKDTHTGVYARQACVRYVRHKAKVLRLSDLHISYINGTRPRTKTGINILSLLGYDI